MPFSLTAVLKENPQILQLEDGPPHYICQLTGALVSYRVGWPGFIVTGAKPTENNKSIRGCFANWNVARRWLLEKKDEISAETFERMDSWLVETATQGLSEEVKVFTVAQCVCGCGDRRHIAGGTCPPRPRRCSNPSSFRCVQC